MRHEYTYTGGCPKQCGSDKVVAFGYCCSDNVDIVCQACGAKDRKLYSKAKDHMQHTGRASIGFIGEVDKRKEMKEILNDMYGPGAGDRVIGPTEVN